MLPARSIALPAILTALALVASCAPAPEPVHESFSVVEASIEEMQAAMREGRVTSRELVEQYLVRIAYYDGQLNAAMHVNRNALDDAERLDAERRAGRVRGPLHGIPVALKDIINTTDMPTTGGMLAFEGYTPPYEATLVTRLREAGAVIIAKTVNTELANWVASAMPTNYSALAGHALNPYDPRRDPREGTSDGRAVMFVGGSSSGIGIAANFWAVGIGTETSGSILSPTNANMLAAIKPTVGRISRHGIMPITADQDTAGPMAKFVADAAILLGVLEAVDPNDPATGACPPPPGGDYSAHLDAGALNGARIGIPRAFFYEAVELPWNDQPSGGLNPAQTELMDEAIATLTGLGAVLIDVEIPSIVTPVREENLLAWGVCAGENDRRGHDEDCSVVLKYGMKRDFNAYLATLGNGAPVGSLTELRQYNTSNSHRNTLKYGQIRLDISDEMDLVADVERYQADRARDLAVAAADGIDAALSAQSLDALLFPGPGSAGIAARPGYPTVMVPFGFVPNDLPGLPDGFEPLPRPFGVSFTGTACSEPRLIELAYAFEQATRRRVAPTQHP